MKWMMRKSHPYLPFSLCSIPSPSSLSSLFSPGACTPNTGDAGCYPGKFSNVIRAAWCTLATNWRLCTRRYSCLIRHSSSSEVGGSILYWTLTDIRNGTVIGASVGISLKELGGGGASLQPPSRPSSPGQFPHWLLMGVAACSGAVQSV